MIIRLGKKTVEVKGTLALLLTRSELARLVKKHGRGVHGKLTLAGRRLMPLVVPLMLLMLALPVQAATNLYYISPTGSDAAAGTIGAPWQNLDVKVPLLTNGDTLFLLDGVYPAAHGISTGHDGSPTNRIAITGGSNAVLTIYGIYVAHSNWTFSGFSMTNLVTDNRGLAYFSMGANGHNASSGTKIYQFSIPDFFSTVYSFTNGQPYVPPTMFELK